MTGSIFDIQEFAVNDGPGLRTCVFMKGCPLRCKWCHNPEGLSRQPQKNLVTGRMVGKEWTVEQLLERLKELPGGITFTGGEASSQAEFVIEVSKGLHKLGKNVGLETCGYCPSDVFKRLITQMDFVYFDLKCMDSDLHEKMTGVCNEQILANAEILKSSGISFRFRVPLTPGVADTEVNRAATCKFAGDAEIEWLPFNDMAAAKYSVYGMKYEFQKGDKS